MNMEAKWTSQTTVSYYNTTRRHNTSWRWRQHGHLKRWYPTTTARRHNPLRPKPESQGSFRKIYSLQLSQKEVEDALCEWKRGIRVEKQPPQRHGIESLSLFITSQVKKACAQLPTYEAALLILVEVCIFIQCGEQLLRVPRLKSISDVSKSSASHRTDTNILTAAVICNIFQY